MLWIVTSFEDYSSSDKDWAWWLCENDDFSVTVTWKKKSKYNRKPLRMATSLGRPFFGGQSIHSLLFQPLYNGRPLSSFPKVAVVESFICTGSQQGSNLWPSGLLLLGQMLYHQVITDSWDLRPLSIVGSFHILVLALCGMFVTQTQLSGLCFLVSLGDSCRASSPGCSKVG